MLTYKISVCLVFLFCLFVFIPDVAGQDIEEVSAAVSAYRKRIFLEEWVCNQDFGVG